MTAIDGYEASDQKMWNERPLQRTKQLRKEYRSNLCRYRMLMTLSLVPAAKVGHIGIPWWRTLPTSYICKSWYWTTSNSFVVDPMLAIVVHKSCCWPLKNGASTSNLSALWPLQKVKPSLSIQMETFKMDERWTNTLKRRTKIGP